MKSPSISGRIASNTRIKAERSPAPSLLYPDIIKLRLGTGESGLLLVGAPDDMIRLRDALNTVLDAPDGETP